RETEVDRRRVALDDSHALTLLARQVIEKGGRVCEELGANDGADARAGVALEDLRADRPREERRKTGHQNDLGGGHGAVELRTTRPPSGPPRSRSGRRRRLSPRRCRRAFPPPRPRGRTATSNPCDPSEEARPRART